MTRSDAAALAARIPDLVEARVACVGDVMLDRFVYGEVSRVSPEAPIPVCRVLSETAMLGGAGNVVRNLVALGTRVEFVTMTGDDGIGADVAMLLRDLEGVSPRIVTEAGRPTTSKTRYVAGGQQLLRADREVTTALRAETADSLAEAVREVVGGARALIVSDYGKGVVTAPLMKELVAAASAAGVQVIVDPKGRDFARYAGASLVTPNLRELAEASGAEDLASEDAIVAAARRVLAEAGIGAMIVTRGAQGMSLVTPDAAEHFPSRAREVFDVSGAGDTVVATLAAGIAAGVPVIEAVQLANVAAGIVVGKSGTAVAYADDLRTELGEPERGGSKCPATMAEALDRIRDWRARGETIGFTNGCFDLLHPGHVSLLSQARATCDRLVVGLNSDASVRRLKGEKRPMQHQGARAAVLSSLETVDLVVLFDEDTPERLLEEIRPDVLVKGADYTIDTVVGAEFVQSYGGRIVLAEIVPGFSTTATIARMNAT